MPRGFRDRDYIETRESLFFCVVGGLHPKSRVISYLKYLPHHSGKWGRNGRRFKRVLKNYTIPALTDTLTLLENEYPDYLFYSAPFKIKMSGVPVGSIRQHYLPETRLQDLLREKKLGILEEKLVSLIELLSQGSGVEKEAFGVTGSILLGIHQTQFSDLDVLVYGRKSSLRVKRTLLSMFDDNSSEVGRLSGQSLIDWCKSKVTLYPMNHQEARELYRRKWNRGLFQSTLFSVHPVLTDSEQLEQYGDRWFNPLGSAIIEAEVSSTSEALFLPSIYEVNNVRILEGLKVEDLREVCSYEGIYSDILEVDEKLIAKGKLEHVRDRRDGREYHRLLIGGPESRGMNYVKPVS